MPQTAGPWPSRWRRGAAAHCAGAPAARPGPCPRRLPWGSAQAPPRPRRGAPGHAPGRCWRRDRAGRSRDSSGRHGRDGTPRITHRPTPTASDSARGQASSPAIGLSRSLDPDSSEVPAYRPGRTSDRTYVRIMPEGYDDVNPGRQVCRPARLDPPCPARSTLPNLHRPLPGLPATVSHEPQIVLDHHVDEPDEVHARRPAEFRASARCIADQEVDLGRA